MKIKEVCKLARQYDREAMTTRQSANFVSGSDVISVRSDVIEPSYEYFVGTVSIVANDKLLFSENATNVGAYHNEKYTQGMFQRAEDAYAYLEETFKGRKFVQAPYQVDWSKLDRGERHWSNPAYAQMRRDEEAEVQKQRETALLDESVDEQITPTPEVDANYFSTYEIHPEGMTVAADGFPTMEAAESHIFEMAANSDQALRKALVMDQWKVIADGTRFEVRQNEAILSTYEYRHSDGLTRISSAPEIKPRLFVDMDGTLARFHDEVQYLERMYEPDFFRDLKPFRGAVESVREFMRQHPDVEVYILSSVIPGYPPGCVQQKQAWLDKYLPEIDHEHRLFPEMGTDKSTAIPGGIRPTDVLLDDYNKNLEEWRQAGGQSVKFVNNINDKALIGERWNGERMHHDAGIQDNVRFLARMTGTDQTPPSQQRGAHL